MVRVLRGAGVTTTLIDGRAARAAERSVALEIDRALTTTDSRVLHVAGHGLYRTAGENAVGGVVIGTDAFISADTIANLSTVPEIVFLNCCSLGQIRPGGAVFDPTAHRSQAASIAQELMKAGVKALVVAGWEVDDSRAERVRPVVLVGAGRGTDLRRRRRAWPVGPPTTSTAWTTPGPPTRPTATPPGASARSGPTTRSSAPSSTCARGLPGASSISGSGLAAHEDRRALASELDQLELHVEHRWPDDGALLAGLARVRGQLGDHERAVDLYERGLADPEGRAPLSVVDQQLNLLGRMLVAAVRTERGRHRADPGAAGRRSGAAPRPCRPRPSGRPWTVPTGSGWPW